MPSLSVIFCDFWDTHNTDGMGVDWRRGRGKGRDYGVYSTIKNAAGGDGSRGGADRGEGGDDDDNRINERSVWRGWQG